MYDSGTDSRAYFEKSTGESVLTVGDCLTYWKEQYVDIALRPKMQALYQATVLKHLVGAFPGRAIGDISVKQWVDFFSQQEKENPRRARQLLAQARTAIGWCIRRQVIDNASSCVLLHATWACRRKPAAGF